MGSAASPVELRRQEQRATSGVDEAVFEFVEIVSEKNPRSAVRSEAFASEHTRQALHQSGGGAQVSIVARAARSCLPSYEHRRSSG
jgi:hypothetical protein